MQSSNKHAAPRNSHNLYIQAPTIPYTRRASYYSQYTSYTIFNTKAKQKSRALIPIYIRKLQL